MSRKGKIGVYGTKTRSLQRRITYEAYGLTFAWVNVYRYLGDATSDIPDKEDINTTVFFEVPDRKYDLNTINVPVGMEPLTDEQMDFSRFGIINPLSDEKRFTIHIDDLGDIGRDLVVGDVFEIPYYERTEDPFYEPQGKRVFWEITDVNKDLMIDKYILVFHATPLSKNRKTSNIPVDDSLDDDFTAIINAAEEEYSDDVKTSEPTFEDDPQKEEVDNRDSVQSNFLDDPNNRF